MTNLTSSKVALLLSVAAVVLCATAGLAQNPTDACRLSNVIPIVGATEPPAKIIVDPPLPGPLTISKRRGNGSNDPRPSQRLR
jgi:hypothetical protein